MDVDLLGVGLLERNLVWARSVQHIIGPKLGSRSIVMNLCPFHEPA